MAVIQTDTTNYFSAAVEDDREVEASSSSRPITPPPVSEADAKTARRAVREKRIAAAVERSKLEYKREHVYTERGWLSDLDHATLKPHSSVATETHKFEDLMTSLYCRHPPQYAVIVEALTRAIRPEVKLGGLSREMLDTGMKSAMATDDKSAALRFAELSRPLWKNQFAGLAVTASDVLRATSSLPASLLPLLMSTSSYGLQLPVIQRMRLVLAETCNASTEESHDRFEIHSLIWQLELLIERRKATFQRPLFTDRDALVDQTPRDEETTDAKYTPIDAENLGRVLELDDEGVAALRGTIRRVEKALQGSMEVEEEVSRGVREL